MSYEGEVHEINIYGYLKRDLIGHGAFAIVYKGHCLADRSRLVAIKCVTKKNLGKAQNLLNKEIAILKDLSTLKHENVVTLFNCMDDPQNVYLIMEYCNGGDLGDYLQRHSRLSEDTISLFFRQVASALSALNTRGIVHRDLKPQNLLLCHPEGQSLLTHQIIIKIADFGFARVLGEGMMAATLCGSPLYMAPEVIMSRPYDSRADLWSVGTVIYQCLTSQAPFHANSPLALKNLYERAAELTPVVPTTTGNDLRDLLLRTLQKNPARRIVFREFSTHPFFDRPHLKAIYMDSSKPSVSQSSRLVPSSFDVTAGRKSGDSAIVPLSNQTLRAVSCLQKVSGVDADVVAPPNTFSRDMECAEKDDSDESEMSTMREDVSRLRNVDAGRFALADFVRASVQDAPLTKRQGTILSPSPVATQSELATPDATVADRSHATLSMDSDSTLSDEEQHTFTPINPGSNAKPSEAKTTAYQPINVCAPHRINHEQDFVFVSHEGVSYDSPFKPKQLTAGQSSDIVARARADSARVVSNAIDISSQNHATQVHNRTLQNGSPATATPSQDLSVDASDCHSLGRYAPMEVKASEELSQSRTRAVSNDFIIRTAPNVRLSPGNASVAYCAQRISSWDDLKSQRNACNERAAAARASKQNSAFNLSSAHLRLHPSHVRVQWDFDATIFSSSPPNALPAVGMSSCAAAQQAVNTAYIDVPLTFDVPELSEETLMDSEHIDLVMKLQLALVICDCLVELLRKNESVVRTVSIHMEAQQTCSDTDFVQSSEAQRCVERLVLNVKLLNITASCFELLRRELRIGHVKPTTTVKKILAELHAVYQKALLKATQLARLFCDKAVLSNSLMLTSLSVSSLHSELQRIANRHISADQLLFDYAVEKCKAVALDEQFADASECYKQYQMVRAVLHYLGEQNTTASSRKVLSSYRDAIERRLLNLEKHCLQG